jgi:hypothetical protein
MKEKEVHARERVGFDLWFPDSQLLLLSLL